jgi:hypothetical protein
MLRRGSARRSKRPGWMPAAHHPKRMTATGSNGTTRAVPPTKDPRAADVTPDQLALSANTGGRRVAAVCQLRPASADANTSPDVDPK